MSFLGDDVKELASRWIGAFMQSDDLIHESEMHPEVEFTLDPLNASVWPDSTKIFTTVLVAVFAFMFAVQLASCLVKKSLKIAELFLPAFIIVAVQIFFLYKYEPILGSHIYECLWSYVPWSSSE